jgi:REP element-mobilizing transposase RayT
MARLPRYVFSDGFFHVTARGAGKIRIYRDEHDFQTFLGLLATIVRKHDWRLHAHCLMTNHYHLVIEATVAQLSAGFQRLNGRYAQGFNGRHGRWGHLFGERFWTGAIEDEEELVAVCRYVVENPVRAGLCSHPADWPWTGWRYGPLRDLGNDEGEQHHGDHAVHGEERGIQPPQIPRTHQRVLVPEQQRRDPDAEPVRDAEV